MPANVSRIPASSSTMRMLCMLRGRRRRRGFKNYGEFYDKSRADGIILFHADGAVVIFDDAADDGQAEPGPALLGRKIRQEEFFLELAGYAVARVGDGDLDRVAAGHQCRRNLNLTHHGILRR